MKIFSFFEHAISLNKLCVFINLISSFIYYIKLKHMSNLSTDREAYDYIFKYILIGNGNSGKTSLLYHCIHSKCKNYFI
jgi:hypothetical protein